MTPSRERDALLHSEERRSLELTTPPQQPQRRRTSGGPLLFVPKIRQGEAWRLQQGFGGPIRTGVEMLKTTAVTAEQGMGRTDHRRALAGGPRAACDDHPERPSYRPEANSRSLISRFLPQACHSRPSAPSAPPPLK